MADLGTRIMGRVGVCFCGFLPQDLIQKKMFMEMIWGWGEDEDLMYLPVSCQTYTVSTIIFSQYCFWLFYACITYVLTYIICLTKWNITMSDKMECFSSIRLNAELWVFLLRCCHIFWALINKYNLKLVYYIYTTWGYT